MKHCRTMFFPSETFSKSSINKSEQTKEITLNLVIMYIETNWWPLVFTRDRSTASEGTFKIIWTTFKLHFE